MNRYQPLKASASTTPTFYIDSHVAPNHLFEDACFRIRAATSLLETLTSATVKNTNDADLYRLMLPVYVLLQDGLDTLDQITLTAE
ncbi:hypothetical protein [Pseudomonas sp. 10S4]|uniref:hypothetical protein n=1 Tax=Pseudomonas sp. 10S4 TaxID=3048583 RepID=UPI002AC97AFD|nr:MULTISPECIES: hypothetical protein [unclassified Pseudomonas]MEB0227220.1 hypothetical protein [Pseudomonas sp. 5S1]MEB0295876.1 hypothetical protein [Pseudomonas sp. 10S4]WPX20456.1 hypothetical protein RHM58_11410 [Pseudomonas sp. 10S4]